MPSWATHATSVPSGVYIRAAAETTPSRAPGAVPAYEQPLVHADGAVPPHGLVQAGDRQPGCAPRTPWRRSTGSSISESQRTPAGAVQSWSSGTGPASHPHRLLVGPLALGGSR